MDIVTHALVGAATALCAARSEEIRVAAITGALAGVLPDADALIRSSDDPLLYIEYHRHFSHSLAFIPLGALLVAGVAWVCFRRSMPFGRLYLFSLLGISLAAVLDACTSYGTHLLWPFAETRIAWNVVSVFDPLLTILISVPVILAITRHRPGVAIVSLFVCATYLGLGSIQHARALRLVEEYASVHSLRADRLLVKPTFGNIVLWRGMAQTRDAIHVAGLRPALFGEGRVYPGERAKRFDADDYAALPSDSRLHRDLDRFRFFSDDLLAHSTVDVDRIGDARYAMRPDRLKPIWSVSFDANSPNRPVDLNTDREMSKEDRDQFLRMLMGR